MLTASIRTTQTNTATAAAVNASSTPTTPNSPTHRRSRSHQRRQSSIGGESQPPLPRAASSASNAPIPAKQPLSRSVIPPMNSCFHSNIIPMQSLVVPHIPCIYMVYRCTRFYLHYYRFMSLVSAGPLVAHLWNLMSWIPRRTRSRLGRLARLRHRSAAICEFPSSPLQLPPYLLLSSACPQHHSTLYRTTPDPTWNHQPGYT